MLAYILLVPLLYAFAYLPTPALYKLADVLAFFLRVVIKYRKEVVYTNLKNSFPEKSEQEIDEIARQSYTNLADRVAENIKCLTIKEKEFLMRCEVEDIDHILNFYRSGKDVVMLIAHAGCWEWAGYVAHTRSKFNIYGVYSPATNKYFNDLVISTRGKMGMRLISMKDTSNYFKEKKEDVNLHIFFSDQSPSNPNNAYWTKFLNQDTPFFYGGARYAIKHSCAVVFANIIQLRRGYYTVRLSTIKEDATNCTSDEIVQRFAELLEQQLKERPADWLWSHKRWKHKRK